jgi:sugar/nucleoside kinase (ribokinase family)
MANTLCRASTFALLSRDVTRERARLGLYRIKADHGVDSRAVNSPARDVLVVGDLNPDLLVSGGDVVPRFGQQERYASMYMTLGGSAGIFAAGAARLGLRTALVACIGDDAVGDMALSALRARDVDAAPVRRLAGERTGLTIHFLRADDRAMLTEPGTFAAVTVRDAIAQLAPAPRHVHVASLFLLPDLLAAGGELVAAAHAAGATISVDTNDDPAGRFARPGWLTSADILFPNEREALALAGGEDAAAPRSAPAEAARDEVVAAARVLAAAGALVVVKRGAAGALAVRGDEVCEVALPAREAVDAVGAGDSFDAGFLAAHLAGRALRDALRLGCACGALSTRAAGGVDGQPTLAEAQALSAG